MKRVSWLALSVVAVWAAGALPAALLLDGAPACVSAIAAGICFVPAALTLWVIDRMQKRTPEERVVAALAAPFARMILAGGGGVWAYFDVPMVHDHGAAFVAWMVVFYLVTLAVETRLLYIITSGRTVAEPSNR